MHFVDYSRSALSNTRMTKEGYLIADAFAVRAGVQQYLGAEVGRADLPLVNVYRPEEEVFKKDSVTTFTHAPITVDHPEGGVNAESWKQLAVGEVSTEALRDGERLRLQLVVKDANAIKQVTSGAKRQLSAGYTCDLDWVDGVAPDGTRYQAVQRNIKINHLALVEKGRAGNCQIGDSTWVAPIAEDDGVSPHKPKEVPVTTKVIVLGDKAVRVIVEDAQNVEDYVAKLNQDMASLNTNVQTKDGEIAALKQQLSDAQMTPEKLQKMLADRKAVETGYKALTGKDAEASKTDMELRRDAVIAKIGDSAKDMSDEAVLGAFRAFTADPPKPKDPLVGAQPMHQDSQTNLDAIFAASGVPMKKEA